jgi:hypothetical protein
MYSLYDNCNHNAKYTGYVRLVCCHSHVCFRPATAKTVAPRSGCSWTALYLQRWQTGGVRRRTRSTCRAGRWPPRCRTCRTCSGSHTRRRHTAHTSAGTSLARVRTSLFHVLMTRSISTSRPSRTRIPRTVIRLSVARYVFRNLNY